MLDQVIEVVAIRRNICTFRVFRGAVIVNDVVLSADFIFTTWISLVSHSSRSTLKRSIEVCKNVVVPRVPGLEMVAAKITGTFEISNIVLFWLRKGIVQIVVAMVNSYVLIQTSAVTKHT
jgi:hypothetical protein